MKLRIVLVSGLAICSLGVTIWAQGQNGDKARQASAGVSASLPHDTAGYLVAFNSPVAQDSTSQTGGQSAGGNTSQQNAGLPPHAPANPNQNANEQPAPQGPRYLTFTKEANPGLDTGSASGAPSSVTFGSAPIGADVTVNGYYVGRTPTTISLPPGEYLVTINKWGYREWDNVVNTSGGKPATFSPTLKEDW